MSRHVVTRILGIFCLLCVIASSLWSTAARAKDSSKPYAAFEFSLDQLHSWIANTRPASLPTGRLTGITVPHHLLVGDLIARAFWAASATKPKRILMLTPDHFKRSEHPFATTARDFETVKGLVSTDRMAAANLLKERDLIERSDLFETEHGVQALLPFVAHFFPDAKVVPIAVSISSRKPDWDRVLPLLLPLIDDDTLIVQSTDFSHYLRHHQAVQRDQEVLNILATGDADALPRLRQPDHMDSIGSQYLQMKLQVSVFGAKPNVIANSNSQLRFRDPLGLTTSYIVQLYCRPKAERHPCGFPRDSKTMYFAGDALFGRNFFKLLTNDKVATVIVQDVLSLTGGQPLVLNLEGVIIDEVPRHIRSSDLFMSSRLTLQWLIEMNVVAVSLANNHSMDFGAAAYREMVQILEGAGILTLSHGDVKHVGSLYITALTDLDNNSAPHVDRIGDDEIERLPIEGLSANIPLVAFIHWGQDGDPGPHPREFELIRRLNRRSVSVVVGNHSHIASDRLVVSRDGATITHPSLGNFLFDQFGPKASGSLLEINTFEQGTVFVRLVNHPNYYEYAQRLSSKGIVDHVHREGARPHVRKRLMIGF